MRKNILFLVGLLVVASTASAQTNSSASKKAATKKTPAKQTSAAKKSAASTAAATPRVEAPWRVVHSDSKLLVTLDTSQSERMPDGTYRTRMRWKYTIDQKIDGGKSYRTMIEYKLLECKKVRSKPIRATAYDVDGNPVSSFSTPDDELQYLMWSKRKVGTVNDNALVKSCQLLATSRKK